MFTIPEFNRKLGYYKVGTKEFSSKILACLHATETNQQVSWDFNDRVFNSYDWTMEPQESIDELYNRRARQLREKYDYVIISYSGGADSHNILMSFVRQGLHVDEIVVNHFEKASKQFVDLNPLNQSAENAGAEHYLQTLPRLKEIHPLIPKTKITIADLTDHLFELMENTGDASWVLNKREGINPAGATRFNYLHIGDVRKRFDKKKSICMIIGIEKPRAAIVEGNLILRFVDRAANQNTVAEHLKDYTNSAAEYFYWSPDCVPLLIKQGHIIKKYLSANTHMQQHWYAPNIDYNKVRLVHERILRTLIYTTWDNNWWQADKSTSDWYSEFDLWFSKGYSNTKAVNVWKEGIDFVNNKLNSFINDNGDGLKHFHKFYNLGPIPNILPEFSK